LKDLHIQRRVTCPALPATYLHRETLVTQILGALQASAPETGVQTRTAPYELLLLHAPAGYGKTTLLVDVAQRTNLPCCWYFLDETDTDRITFLTTLLMSIRQQFPDFGPALDPLITGVSSERANTPDMENYFEVVLDLLVNAMETEIPGRFVLLLCNYQQIDGLTDMNALVNTLLHKLPPQGTLVIESRIIPHLDFAQLLARQLIFGIGIDQLRFTAPQIHHLAQMLGVGPFTDAEAHQLALSFDGWIAGILLGTRLSNVQQLQSNPPSSTGFSVDMSEPQVASQYLFSYVVNEVFKSHQGAYAFLKEACVLQEMPPDLCAALLDISPTQAAAHLHYLEQQSLFVTHSGEGTNPVYTCTPVLRNLFLEELRRDAPERFSQLHQRAAELLSASQHYRQAISHALEAQVNDIAANLIIASAEQMMNQGHAETLTRWIKALPDVTTKRFPQLLLIQANIYLRQGEDHAVIPLLDAADAAVQTLLSKASALDPQNFPAVKAMIAIVRSKVLWQQREYRQGQTLCQQVLDDLPADEVTIRAEAHMCLGSCYVSLGDFLAGIAQLQKALQLWGRHSIQRQTADGHSLLARAYGFLGNFALAEHHMARALACWEQLQDSWGKVHNLVRLGNIKVWQGAFSEAEPIFQQSLELARGPIQYLRGQAYALDCLGICYLRQERFEMALEVTEEALALARQISDPFLINEVLEDLAMIYLFMGDTATAMILISEVEVKTSSSNSLDYEQAIYNLIYGTISLSQGQDRQAWQHLSTSEAALGKMDLKQEHLQALMRLAAYNLGQDQHPEAVHCLERAARIISICEGYERVAQLEVRHFPNLEQALRTLPQAAQLRALLHLEALPPAAGSDEALFPMPEPQAPTPAVPLPLSLTTVTQPHPLTILALGEPVVSLHQEPITRWRMARSMELCFYLLDCGRPMRKETIITELWPEVDEQTIRTFYSTVYYLRQALGGEAVIVAKGGSYMLRLEALYGQEVWYDVRAFEEAQARAKQALDNGQDGEAKSCYLTMVELYRGDYVQSFYSDWCAARRDELRNAYLDARQQLARIAWREEQLDESIMHWQHMLAVDNWLEEAHYGLMRCYARQGKRGLALRQYQRCKETLEQEFGAAPRASIQNFYQRLMGSL
jgi:ATP/maltotriose-dependent transcriptional regulator MalT/DNA-binding SARP family transcriptional activator